MKKLEAKQTYNFLINKSIRIFSTLLTRTIKEFMKLKTIQDNGCLRFTNLVDRVVDPSYNSI